MYNKCQGSGTAYTCSRSFGVGAGAAGWGGRPVTLPRDVGVGRTRTVEWRRSARGKFQAEGLALAHLGNAPVFFRRKDDRVAFNYLKDPCVKWALESGRDIIVTA